MTFKTNLDAEITALTSEIKSLFPNIDSRLWGIEALLFEDGDYTLTIFHTISDLPKQKTAILGNKTLPELLQLMRAEYSERHVRILISVSRRSSNEKHGKPLINQSYTLKSQRWRTTFNTYVDFIDFINTDLDSNSLSTL